MVYVTVMQSPMYRQMSVEELLFGSANSAVINDNTANTRTQAYENLPIKFLSLCIMSIDINLFISHFILPPAIIRASKIREPMAPSVCEIITNVSITYYL